MKKLLFVLLSLILLTIIFLFIVLFLNKETGKGALQVTSNPKSKVYIDGKYIGQTPICKCQLPQMLAVGEYTVKIVADGGNSFEEKIKINPAVLTVVDRSFEDNPSSQGSIITLDSISDKSDVQLLIVSFPNQSQIFLDNNSSGTTPLLLKHLTPSDHEIKLTKEGFKEQIVKIRTVQGFRLETNIFMGINDVAPAPIASQASVPNGKNVQILPTPTGYLRVRTTPSVTALEVGRVNPGETYSLISEQSGWYQIKLKDGKIGWISTDYASKK